MPAALRSARTVMFSLPAPKSKFQCLFSPKKLFLSKFLIFNLILLDFLRKQELMLTIQSAIFIGKFVKRLLVPHNTTSFFSDGGITKFLACQSTFSARSPPIPKFNAFNDVKYICHSFKYLERPLKKKTPWPLFINGIQLPQG